MPADIFISYSRKDQDFVFQLNADLERRGISSFVDQSGIIAGDVWRRQIVDAIEACRVFLLVLSPNSTISENVIKELSIAESKRKRILPILYQPVEIPVGMEYQLAGLQYQAFDRGDYSKNFSRLLDAISRLGIQLHTEKIERVPLPPELQSAIESPLSSVREGVVRELDRLLNGSIPGLALSAHEELKQLVDDDSRRVANAATQVLEAYSAKSKAKMDVASQERLTREKAEAERVARERAEAQHLAAQRAEAERASNEKAEQERLAREHAEAERVARQKAEQERLAVITPRKFIKERPERRNLWGWALFGIGFSTLSYSMVILNVYITNLFFCYFVGGLAIAIGLILFRYYTKRAMASPYAMILFLSSGLTITAYSLYIQQSYVTNLGAFFLLGVVSTIGGFASVLKRN